MTSPGVDWRGLFETHLESVTRSAQEALARSGHTGLVLHAGSEALYHADDQHVPFHAVPHFARFAPVPGAEHLLLLEAGEAPRLVRVVPRGFWEEPPAEPPLPLAELLTVDEVGTPREAREAVGQRAGWAYVGNDSQTAAALGIAPEAVEPKTLLATLDWERGFKTEYEQACLREAARLAALGHDAVREGVAAGRTERALHFAYLEASGHLDHETPYPNIIAWDEASAVLHYQSKRTTPPTPGHTFLIDAGATHLGYASDVTRTYLRDGVQPVFRTLWERMRQVQDELVERVSPGLEFVELHEAAFRRVTELLCEVGVLTVGADEAFEAGLTFPFFPHGLGHHLGLQVHDVGGKQRDASGELVPPPERYPWLRTTRPLAPGNVITIEPGLYFIPLLLDPYREGEQRGAFAWDLIDALIPCGGIRIEDDVLVTPEGRENLSRPFLPT